MWIILALMSALFAASRRVSEKRLSQEMHHFTMGWAVQLSSLPFILLAASVTGQMLDPLQLRWEFWLAVIGVSVGFYPLNSFLYGQALRHGELSGLLPIMSLWPVLSLLPAWLFLHETPSLLGVAGIVTTVVGIYVLGLKGRRLHRPWEPFVESKSSRYTLFAVVLVTLVGIVDKWAINMANALFFSLCTTTGAVIVLSYMAAVHGDIHFASLKRQAKSVSAVGLFQGMSNMTYMAALSAGPVAYITAVRSSSSLIGSLLGIFVLKEKFTLPKKLSFMLIAAGSLLLALS